MCKMENDFKYDEIDGNSMIIISCWEEYSPLNEWKRRQMFIQVMFVEWTYGLETICLHFEHVHTQRARNAF